jgi:hypothetical protein
LGPELMNSMFRQDVAAAYSDNWFSVLIDSLKMFAWQLPEIFTFTDIFLNLDIFKKENPKTDNKVKTEVSEVNPQKLKVNLLVLFSP